MKQPCPPVALILQLCNFLCERLRCLTQLPLKSIVGNLMLPDLHLQVLNASVGLPASAVTSMELLLQLQLQVLDGPLEFGVEVLKVFHLSLLVLVDVLQACQLSLGTKLQS